MPVISTVGPASGISQIKAERGFHYFLWRIRKVIGISLVYLGSLVMVTGKEGKEP